jgi:hypothetical protein
MQLVTPKGTAHYSFVFRAQPAMDPSKEPQFCLTLAFDKADPKLKKLKDAILEVAKAKFGAKAGQMLEKGQLKDPLRDGDKERSDDEKFVNKFFLTARSNSKPGVVDADAEPMMDQEDFYSGCTARADIWLYAFDKAGNKGVAAILNNAQKLADGERLAGRRSASDAFKEAEDELL